MNLLIVDDQKAVVEGLYMGINYKSLGISNVYKAYSVADARLIFQNLNIHILLTDIEMPGESGIALVSWVKEQGYDTECIFLTSHADFHYANEALKMGSFDYILQPSPYEDIAQILAKAVQKIILRNEKQEYYNIGYHVKNDFTIQRTLFFSAVTSPQGYLALKKMTVSKQTDIPEFQGYLAILRIRQTDALAADWEPELLEFSISNICSEYFASFHEQTFFCQTEPSLYALFLYDDLLSDHFDFIQFQLDHLCDTIQEVLHIKTKILSMENPIPLSRLCASYEQLKQKIQEPPANPVPMAPASMEADYTASQMVTVVKEYIDSHPEGDLSRPFLADLVHLNVDYLARIFHAQTGYTLNNYIIDVRMKLAQNLIQTTNLPISLIAMRVGYDNFSYFSKVYKKVIGISPSEERKR